MTVCVFLGPTMPRNEAQAILPDARFLPPVRQGDIPDAVLEKGAETLVLIDGMFEQVPAVWHKEILWALEQGITVCGASSMGALRASELAPFGMIGHGRIYEAYLKGVFPPFSHHRFEDDDEVAVIHAPEALGYAGSVAMVDIRATLDAAHRDRILELEDRDRLCDLAKGLFYKDRHYRKLLAKGSEDGLDITAFEAWLETGKVSQKRLDAEGLLKRVAAGQINPVKPAFRFEHTTVWDSALQAAIDRLPPENREV